MREFRDEFLETENAVIPATPTKYVKLKDIKIIERDLDTFPEDLKQQAIERYKLISLIEKENSKGWTQRNLDPILDKIFAADMSKRPNWRTLVRWREKYLKGNGRLVALVNKRHEMGNRKSRVQGDEAIFEEALERFLDATRPSIAHAYQYYCDRIEISNGRILDNDKIPKVSYKSFRIRIKALPPYVVAVCRYGKQRADKLFSFFDKRIPATRILERVEIDHTPLDLILLDDEFLIPIGRPYLTLLVDTFSGCVVGFYLTYNPPSYVSVAKAIVHAIKPKKLDNLGIDLQNDWPCYGKMETICVDNGAEFWSTSLEKACLDSKINVHFSPVDRPWARPFVERFFGMINQYLLEPLPGKTFSNILKRGGYRPEKDAIIRFSTFVREFTRWIVDIHHQDSDSRETRIPILNWRKGFDAFPPLKMTEEDEARFETHMWITVTAKLRKGGINFGSLTYNSTALTDYRKQYPQTKKSSIKTVKRNPDDLSSILVYLEELGGYIAVDCNDEVGYTKGLSIYEHKTIEAYNRDFIRESLDPKGLAKARLLMIDSIKEEQKLFTASKKPVKLSKMKIRAQYAGISSSGKGTIKIPDNQSETKLVDQPKAVVSNILDLWGEDVDSLEAF